MKPIGLSIALLLIVIISLQPYIWTLAVPPTLIIGKVVDARTGDPIPNATVLIWDVSKLDTPRPGAGIYTTDLEGRYTSTAPYVVPGHSYWVYAYRGNISAAQFDYVPSARRELPDIEPGQANVTIRLVPAATIVLYGKVWDFNSTSPPYRTILTVVAPLSDSAPDMYGASYVTTYGTVDTFFLGLGNWPTNLTVVPSGVKVELKADAWFFSREVGIFVRSFRIDNDRQSFVLEQGAPPTLVQLADYSLRKSSDMVGAYISRVTSATDENQQIGFYVWEERINLREARGELNDAMSQLSRANYLGTWILLRQAYSTSRAVSETLGYMRLVAAANSVYMPAVFAIFAVVLGFFAFENNRRKLFASLLFYLVLMAVLFVVYPGTKLLATENFVLFLGTAFISIFVAIAITFGVPRIWKERDIEGQVSLRSVIPVIFSMAKRQVWRHRSRSLFAILSIVILVLAFTSLTSFGTVYGLMSATMGHRTAADGVMVKRLQPNSTQWTEIPKSDLDLLPTLFSINSVCPKAENIPSSEPLASIFTSYGRIDVYGVLGLDPILEPRYSQVQQIVTQGDFLSQDMEVGILMSSSAASDAGIRLLDEVQFVVRGKPIRNMTVIGFFDDQLYGSLLDFDGRPFAPSRALITDETTTIATCNGTDVVIMPLQTALRLQDLVNELMRGSAPQFAAISRITFTPDDWQNFGTAIRTLTFAQEYTVYESRFGTVTSYFLGFRYETKGAAEVVIPIAMVVLNVAAVMLNSVYERRKEMQVLTLVGLNPVHIGTVFVAEAIVVGLVGGGIGYILGLGFYQIMTFFGEGLTVRAKLEWWWSAVGLGLALVASVLSSLRPAMVAVTMYTPSMMRRTKVSQKERERRKKEVFKVFQAAELSMPVRLLEQEVPFFLSMVLDRLRDLQTGLHETVKNLEEVPPMETPEGDRVNKLKFEFYKVDPGAVRGTRNELTCAMNHGEEYYRVLLKVGPAGDNVPEEWNDRTVMMVRDICLDWIRNKQKLIGQI